MIPGPPTDVPAPTTNLDDAPMGSSTPLTFVKLKKDRTGARPAASVNKSSANTPPDAAPLAERINANKPHAFAPSQPPLPAPGVYGSETGAPPIEHAPHRAFHHRGRGRNLHLLAEDTRVGTPEHMRLGTSFRPIDRLRLDAANLPRARSPMLPPPVPASAGRQPQLTNASESVISFEAPHSAVVVTLTGERPCPDREEQNEEQNVSQICWSDDRVSPLVTQENESILGEGPPMMGSEEPIESPLAQDLRETSIPAAPQTVTGQTPLIEYLTAHAEESAQAEKRWRDASLDEWKAGAQGECIIRVMVYSNY